MPPRADLVQRCPQPRFLSPCVRGREGRKRPVGSCTAHQGPRAVSLCDLLLLNSCLSGVGKEKGSLAGESRSAAHQCSGLPLRRPSSCRRQQVWGRGRSGLSLAPFLTIQIGATSRGPQGRRWAWTPRGVSRAVAKGRYWRLEQRLGGNVWRVQTGGRAVGGGEKRQARLTVTPKRGGGGVTSPPSRASLGWRGLGSAEPPHRPP